MMVHQGLGTVPDSFPVIGSESEDGQRLNQDQLSDGKVSTSV
jgi:hypothetical protein